MLNCRYLQFGNLNSGKKIWMMLQFQYPLCHCVVMSNIRSVALHDISAQVSMWEASHRYSFDLSISPGTSEICHCVFQNRPLTAGPSPPPWKKIRPVGGLGPSWWGRTIWLVEDLGMNTSWLGDLVCPQIPMTVGVNAMSFRAFHLDPNQRQPREIRLLVLYLSWCNLLFSGLPIWIQYLFTFWFIAFLARATREPPSLAQRGFQLEVWDFCWGTVGQILGSRSSFSAGFTIEIYNLILLCGSYTRIRLNRHALAER